MLQGRIRQRVRELFCEIAGHHGFKIKGLDVDKDHVYLFLSFPPKYSISTVVGLTESGQRQGDWGGVSGGPKAAMGRGVLGRWVFCLDGG